jgi:hypothetical protein
MLVDTLYRQILTSTLSELDDDLRASRLEILYAILCACTRISTSTIADLLGTDKDVANHFVQSLHPVLYISTKDNGIYWCHASFQDFIFDPHRSRFTILDSVQILDVSCNQPIFHTCLAHACFNTMGLQLRFNICELLSSFLLDSEVGGLEEY